MADTRNSPPIDSLSAEVFAFLSRYCNGSPRIAVAYSGGLDSSVLLHLAHRFCSQSGRQLYAAHVHHGLSVNADHWASFCAETSCRLGVPFQCIRVEVPPSPSEGVESAARALRYAFFAQIDAEHVLLAHHQDDQAETLLLNLLRGAGVRGAAGMLPVGGNDNRYLRPLLGFSRADLTHYAEVHGVEWVDDESNADIRYSRNYLRRQVFPGLKQRFPSVLESLARSASHFAEAQTLLDQLAELDLNGDPPYFPLAVSRLSDIDSARGANLLRYLLAISGQQSPSSVRLRECLRQFIEAAPDRHPALTLPAYRLYRRQGKVFLELFQSS